MSRIPDEIIQQVRDRIDVVELVGRSVSLKRAGRNYKGLCPFHHEKTPSFNVNPDRGTFYCFGCHEGGDVFAFLQKTEGLDFPTRCAAWRATAASRSRRRAARSRDSPRASTRPTRCCSSATARSSQQRRLPGRAPISRSAASRPTTGSASGSASRPTAGTSRSACCAARASRWSSARRAGILSPRQSGGHYDRLRGRVVFPIRDARGRVVGFGGRAIAADRSPST